jgi:hypothetical protein
MNESEVLRMLRNFTSKLDGVNRELVRYLNTLNNSNKFWK